MLYATSDLHLNHGNIVKYTKRPFANTDEMNAELIRRWNNVVQPTDTVLHLGDLCFNKKDKDFNYWSSRLNGNKIFLQGNHDSHIDAPIQSLVFKYGGIDWWCSHYPERRYKYNLHGHEHGKNYKIKKIGGDVLVDCSVDNWDYTPISMEKILDAVRSP